MEGWTNVMYNYMDASGPIAAVYFPVLVILGSFFLLNLFLAVIMETFSEMNERQLEKDKAKEKFKLELMGGGGDIPLRMPSNVEHMMKVTKKKVEAQRGYMGNLGDAALMLKYMNE